MTNVKIVLSVFTFRLDITQRFIRLSQLTIRMESKNLLISAIFISNRKRLLTTDVINNSSEMIIVYRVVFYIKRLLEVFKSSSK